MEPGHERLNERRNRRNRIQRIRNGITAFVLLWMIAVSIVLGFLGYKVVSLEREVRSLTTGELSRVSVETEPAQAMHADEGGVINSDGDTAESNLANPEDTLKVYLTFDDGPSSYTNQILDILDDYNVKATFFVNGREDPASLAAYQRIVDEGHTLAMHSYSHRYHDIYASADAFAQDFERLQTLLYDTTGVDCQFYRFPGGSDNGVSQTDITELISFLNAQDVTYFDWNVQSESSTARTFSADDIVENVLSGVVEYKTSIVLLHDAETKASTVEALPRLIEELQARGAVLLPISEDTTVIQHVTVQEEP